MLIEILKEHPTTPFMILDGLDKAVIGYELEPESKLKYSFYEILNILMERDGMSYTEAVEFFYFNIEPLRCMEHGAKFIDDFDEEEIA